MVKVGKLKKGPVNKTDTSFTAKKVVIRAQNIKSSSISTSDESSLLARIRSILPNCGHYNANMRKEATLNVLKLLKELDDLQSANFLSILDPIFVATFRQLCDEEINVRSAFFGLISFLLENVKKENLMSFFPRWISFLSLASSHIKPEIRKDSVRFINVTLKHQNALFTPFLHTFLPILIPLMTQFPQRQGASPAFDCTLNMIEAYLQPFQSQNDVDALAKPLNSYTWQSDSIQPTINLIRFSPFSSSQGSISSNPKPNPIPESSLVSLISHMGNLSISLWLDTAHLLNNKTTSKQSQSHEFRQLQELLSLYKNLLGLVKCSGESEELFWSSMPVKLIKNYKKVLEQELIKQK